MMLVQDDRLANLIELGVDHHPDVEKVAEFIRQGAAFVVRHSDDHEHIEVGLRFSDTAPMLAALRAERAGAEAETPDPAREGEYLLVIRAPTNVLQLPPQG